MRRASSVSPSGCGASGAGGSRPCTRPAACARRPDARRLGSTAGLALAASTWASTWDPALARAEQRELSLHLQPVYGITYMDDRSPSGGGGTLGIGYGITDAVGVQLHGGATVHPLAGGPDPQDKTKMRPDATLLTWHASAGITYALDIVRIVPFFEASVGVLGTVTLSPQGAQQTVNAGISLGLGADYLLTRRWAVGVALRYYAFVTDPARIPLYLTVGPRVLLRFGL